MFSYVSCIFRCIGNSFYERFLFPGRVVNFPEGFQSVLLISVWNHTVTGRAHWSRKCIKIIVILQKRFSLSFCVVLLVLRCQKSFSLLFSRSWEVEEMASRGLLQPYMFYESMIISAFLWRKTSMINMYEQKWVHFIWNVMLPKSIVKFLPPSRETKSLLFAVEYDSYRTESIIECTGKH